MMETATDVPGIVVVDDDAYLRSEVAAYLRRHGMAVRDAATGADLDRTLDEAPADAVVLDLSLPNEDGIAIAQRLRARDERIGIVMMTARGRLTERVLGYETGADVYLVKPVDYAELAAAIRATLRGRSGGSSSSVSQGELTWSLDLAAWRLVTPSGASIRLKEVEAQVLSCMAEGRGRPVPRERIAERIGRASDQGEHRYVDQVVSRLRRKIVVELGWDAPIGSAYGQGYYVVGLEIWGESGLPLRLRGGKGAAGPGRPDNG